MKPIALETNKRGKDESPLHRSGVRKETFQGGREGKRGKKARERGETQQKKKEEER